MSLTTCCDGKSNIVILERIKGGPGSGHRGHSGRPGQRGGSVPGGGTGLGDSVPAEIRARAKDPYIGVSAGTVPIGQESYRMPYPQPRQPSGAPIRGKAIPVDDPRIPDTVYHMTTNLSAVEASGVLLAKGAGGLGGDSSDEIVSMTVSKDIAFQLAEDMKFVAALADKYFESEPEIDYVKGEGWIRKSDGSPLCKSEWGSPLIRDLRAQARREGWDYKIDSNEQLKDYGLKDWVSHYFTRRERMSNKRNPIFWSDAEELFSVDVSNIGVVAIPKGNLNTGALLTDFDLGQGSLEEVRLYGDVPLQDAGYFAVKQLDESFFDLREEDMKEILVLVEEGDDIVQPESEYSDWEKGFIADIKAVMKSEGDGKHPASHYLVVEDPQSPSTWHLRVRDTSGKVDRRLLGAAWAALHGGYRGNKYEGPNKQEAISKLRKLYEAEDMPTPNTKAVSQCVCPECGYKSDHENGTLCRSKECPECGTRMVGSTGDAEVETVSAAVGRALTGQNATSVDAQVKSSDEKVGILSRFAQHFDDLKSAFIDFIKEPEQGSVEELALVSDDDPVFPTDVLSFPSALKAMEDATLYGSSFISFKGLDGQDWLLTFTTNAFEDREGEIFTTKSIHNYVSEHENDTVKGEYQFWHLPGSKFGDILFQGVEGRFLIEAGTFDDTPTGNAFKDFFNQYPNGHPEIAPTGWGCSHKYEYKSEDREDGVYDWFNKSETTVLPLDAAANPYTALHLVKERTMNERQKKALELIGGKSLVDMVQNVGRKATEDLEANVAYKAKRDFPKELMTIADGLEDEEAKKAVASIAKAMAAPPVPPVEEEEEEAEEKKKQVAEESVVETPVETPVVETPAETPSETPAETPATETPVADTPAAEEAPAVEETEAPAITGDAEYQEAVTESLKTVISHFNERIDALDETIKSYESRLGKVERDDGEKIAEKAVMTPAASLLSNIQRAVGAKENQVDGRTTYAKDRPREADPNVQDGATPVPLLNMFLSNSDQRQ